MNILVTGGAGFIGSHVVDRYVRRGHRVTIVDNLSTGRRSNLNPKARFVRADLLSPSLRNVLERGRFEVVNHHAAQIDVRKSVSDPEFDARVNILGLLRVLQLSQRTKVRQVIFSSSGGTYYGECARPAKENSFPNPLSPYGVAKLAGEAYLNAYRALHGMRCAVLRYGNVYGPRQDPHGEAGVVAIFGPRMLSNESIMVYGNGRQERDYVFVEDVAEANELALQRRANNVFNIGTGRATSVNELAALMAQIVGYSKQPLRRPPRVGELQRSCLNVEKARRALGWRARTSLREGLEKTIEHFRLEK